MNEAYLMIDGQKVGVEDQGRGLYQAYVDGDKWLISKRVHDKALKAILAGDAVALKKALEASALKAG